MEDNNSAVAIIMNSNGEFLLQKKDSTYKWGSNTWSFFGGKIEINEDPLKALKREI